MARATYGNLTISEESHIGKADRRNAAASRWVSASQTKKRRNLPEMQLGHLDAQQSKRSDVHSAASAAFQRAASRPPEIMHVAGFDGNNVRLLSDEGRNSHGLCCLPPLIGYMDLPS